MSTALDMIERERNRQVDEEQFTAAFDDQVNGGEQLAVAAACYLCYSDHRAEGRPEYVRLAVLGHDGTIEDPWRWKAQIGDVSVTVNDGRGKHDRLRRLVIAGALTLAAIDQELRRLCRTEVRAEPATATADEEVPASPRPRVPASSSAEPQCSGCRRPAVLCVCERTELQANQREGEP